MVEALLSSQYPTKMISISIRIRGKVCQQKIKWWDKMVGYEFQPNYQTLEIMTGDSELD